MIGDCLLTFLHIIHVCPEGRAPAFEVIVGMIADGMTGLDHLGKDFRMLVDILPHHKERGLDLVAGKDR